MLAANLQRAIGQWGKQHAPPKVKTSIRLSPEVIKPFKGEEGEGW